MKNKIIGLGIAWLAVIIATLSLAVFMPATQPIIDDSVAAMEANSDAAARVGAAEAVGSMPYWIYALPGLCGAVYTAYVLKFKRER